MSRQQFRGRFESPPLVAVLTGAVIIVTLSAITMVLSLSFQRTEINERKAALSEVASVLAGRVEGIITGSRTVDRGVHGAIIGTKTPSARRAAIREEIFRAFSNHRTLLSVEVIDEDGRLVAAESRIDAPSTPARLRLSFSRGSDGLNVRVTYPTTILGHTFAGVGEGNPTRAALFDRQGRQLAASRGWKAQFGNTRDGIVARQSLHPVPWTVVVFYPRSEALKGWVRGAIMSGVAVILLNVALVFLIMLAGRYVQMNRVRIAAANQLARRDFLTGLANRLHFSEELQSRLVDPAPPGELALLLIDLDGFKNVNDNFGHVAGDELIALVADRMRSCVSESDFIARLGGDEFAIIRWAGTLPEGVLALSANIKKTFSTPFAILGGEVRIGASIGAALGKDASDATDLLRKADLALYAGKAKKTGRLSFFEPKMTEEVERRCRLQTELAEAVDGDQFVLAYQPIFDLETGSVRSCEALIRWQRPDQSIISPDEFVPQLEANGAIIQVGEQVLRKACRDAALWPGEVRVAVNLSPIQCRSPDLVETVKAALAGAGLPADRLELEITESVSLDEAEASVSVLHRLKALGVRVALDDFGTGYASLSYLTRFPFDKIKIDRSFIAGLSKSRQNDVIVRSTIELALQLGMHVTAEGVETREQLRLLMVKGCSEAQGYLLSRPIPAGKFQEFLTRGNCIDLTIASTIAHSRRAMKGRGAAYLRR